MGGKRKRGGREKRGEWWWRESKGKRDGGMEGERKEGGKSVRAKVSKSGAPAGGKVSVECVDNDKIKQAFILQFHKFSFAFGEFSI